MEPKKLIEVLTEMQRQVLAELNCEDMELHTFSPRRAHYIRMTAAHLGQAVSDLHQLDTETEERND